MLFIRNIPSREAIEALSKRFPEVEPSSVETLLHLLRVSTDIIEAGEKRWHKFGMSPGRFSVLMILFRSTEDSLTPAVIADRIGVTRATITGLVDKLVRDKIVERVPSRDDRRKVNISLTEEGRKLLQRYLPAHFAGVTTIMKYLDEREKATFRRLLTKVKQGVIEAQEQLEIK